MLESQRNSPCENFSYYTGISSCFRSSLLPGVSPKIKTISTKISQFISFAWQGLKDTAIGIKIRRIFEKGRVDLGLMVFGAVFVLVMRGTAGEGQASIFSSLVKNYIEESSSSLAAVLVGADQVKDVNSLLESASTTLATQGQGGEGNPLLTPIEAATIQQNSVVAYAPPLEDYAISIGSKRSDVLEYTVQSGDLISFIASDYGVSAQSILWANGLKDADSISIGQVLKIPPVSGVVHKVQKGDTVASIAKKYSGDEAKIIAFNTLPGDGRLTVGDDIVVPDGRIQPVAVAGSKTIGSTKKIQPFSYLSDLGSFFMIPTTGFNWGKIHGRNGVDIANSCGTAIYAAADGNVAIADDTGWNGGFGKYIKLIHGNGTETLYAHASKLKVSAGDNVSRGQLIAIMGTTGHSTGCHLHFEVHGAKNPLAKN